MSERISNQASNISTESIDPALTRPELAAYELTALIRAHADDSERGRRLAAPVVDALQAAGLFTMGLPVSMGGAELPISTVLRVIEEVAYADGASGWNVMIAFDTGLWAGFIHAPQARELIRSIAQPILAGSVNPPGRITRTAGGYRLTGRWRFGSGCQQADAFIVGAMLIDDANAAGAGGLLQMYQVTLRAGDVRILDTWHVAGLRGTGSHDFAVEDLFVEEGLVQAINFDAPFESGPLYRFGVAPSFAVVKTAVALGIARRAVEALKELALGKTAMGASSLLRERAAVQTGVARAEACVRSASPSE
jgi:alkylation response protein AidB-like acyl-CoA dehydrogenase